MRFVRIVNVCVYFHPVLLCRTVSNIYIESSKFCCVWWRRVNSLPRNICVYVCEIYIYRLRTSIHTLILQYTQHMHGTDGSIIFAIFSQHSTLTRAWHFNEIKSILPTIARAIGWSVMLVQTSTTATLPPLCSLMTYANLNSELRFRWHKNIVRKCGGCDEYI